MLMFILLVTRDIFVSIRQTRNQIPGCCGEKGNQLNEQPNFNRSLHTRDQYKCIARRYFYIHKRYIIDGFDRRTRRI